MPRYITNVEATAIYGRFDLKQHFHPGINVLHGKNGTGKTTLLHILANALNGQYERFAFLNFKSIHIELSDNTEITFYQEKKDGDTVTKVYTPKKRIPISFTSRKISSYENEMNRSPNQSTRRLSEFEKEEPPIATAYFPAFRTMIEAWKSMSEERGILYFHDGSLVNRREGATLFARDLFGKFIPAITYPSPADISHSLIEEYRRASLKVAEIDQKLFSEAFLEIFATISKKSGQVDKTPETILKEIQELISRLGKSELAQASMPDANVVLALRELIQTFGFTGEISAATDILEVYRKSLEELARVQEHAFEEIERYLDAVNGFLDGKELCIRRDRPEIPVSIGIKFDEQLYSGLRALSSGERQIVTMIYAASRMSSQEIVLIDEPEISLHVDWQRLLLKKLANLISDRQIIVCTHSPVVGANYKLMELNFKPSSITGQDEENDLEIIF